jgi:CRISPR-associated protein Cas5d
MSDPQRVSVRVWGDFACFTRPEMKVERVSYPVPTPSAARGILEAIFWEPQMCYLLDHILIVRKGRWFTFRRNEVQKVISLRDTQGWMAGRTAVVPIEAGGGAADAAQRNMLALADVEYVITAEVRLTAQARPPQDNLAKYAEQVLARAARGKCAHRPYLGCREFAADFDLVKDPAAVTSREPFNDDLGLMLYDVFDPAERTHQRHVRSRPVYFKARVEQGRLDCHPDRVELVRPAVARR